MNQPTGAHGFVTMKDGGLYFEDGTPVRFWGTNVSYHQGRGVFMTHADADDFAQMLARLGVNIVRVQILHSANSLIDQTRDDTQHFDPDKLDRLDYLAAALHKRGIYLNLDLIYHRMFKAGDNIDKELVGSQTRDGYNVNWAAGSAALFHPRAIELNRELYKKFLTHVNPYTGKAWLDDPGLAMATIQNEQSIFWGTTNIQKGHPREILDGLYTEWLRQKYGSQAYLAQAWQVAGQPSPFKPGEDLDSGSIELGEVGVQSAPNMVKRGVDQLHFLYHLETKFYSDTIAAMRGWGLKCPIITSNWRGAGRTTPARAAGLGAGRGGGPPPLLRQRPAAGADRRGHGGRRVRAGGRPRVQHLRVEREHGRRLHARGRAADGDGGGVPGLGRDVPVLLRLLDVGDQAGRAAGDARPLRPLPGGGPDLPARRHPCRATSSTSAGATRRSSSASSPRSRCRPS